MPFSKGVRPPRGGNWGDVELPDLKAENLNNDAVTNLCESVLEGLREEYELAVKLSKKEFGRFSGADVARCKRSLTHPFIQSMLAVANTSMEEIVIDVEGKGAWDEWKELYGDS